MKTFVVLHELCKIWSLARFHYELLCNRGQDLIESYLLVNFSQSRSALLLVLSEQMNQYFCSSTMKKNCICDPHQYQDSPWRLVSVLSVTDGMLWNAVIRPLTELFPVPLPTILPGGVASHNGLYGRGGSYRNLFWVQVYRIRERISF